MAKFPIFIFVGAIAYQTFNLVPQYGIVNFATNTVQDINATEVIHVAEAETKIDTATEGRSKNEDPTTNLKPQNVSYKNDEVSLSVPVSHLSTKLWDQRYSKGGHIFFKHLRKAAGTSVRRYLDKVIRFHEEEFERSTNNTAPIVRQYHQEWDAMPWNCRHVDPVWNNSIKIVVLRDPMDRHFSEFFYSGLGSSNKTMKTIGRRVRRDVELESSAVNLFEELLPIWMESGRYVYPGRSYSPDYQTRMMSGNTSLPPREGPHAPCSHGGTRYGGVEASIKDLSMESLVHAKAALEDFDLVLLSETISSPDQAAWIADIFGVPESVASMRRQKANIKTSGANRNGLINPLFKGYPDLIRRLNPKFFERFRSDCCKLDSELYNYAVQLNKEKYEQWKLRKQY